jgi:DNA mismatch endonuclease (patch repair protein)
MIKGSKHTKETKKKISLANAGRVISEETRKKMSVALIGNTRSLGYRHSEKAKKKISVALIGNTRTLGNRNFHGRRHSEESKKKMSLAHIANPSRKFKDTIIELKVEKELINRKIEYVKQHPLCKEAIVDFYLPGINIVIQCDGCYWHNCPGHYPDAYIGRRDRDAEQDLVLTSNGYKVYRFWEHEINTSVSECLDRITKE